MGQTFRAIEETAHYGKSKQRLDSGEIAPRCGEKPLEFGRFQAGAWRKSG
jgi:hypothetical protein